MKIKRSPLFYVGDKYKLLKEIKEYFPINIDRFIEPFLGGGSVFLNVNASKYFLNDIDRHIYMLHQYLVSQALSPDIFFKNIEKTVKYYNLSRSYLEDVVPTSYKDKWKKTYYAKYNKEGYLKLRDHFNKSNKKDMLVLYLLIIYGFNRMLRFNSKNLFNIPVGNVDFNNNTYVALMDYFNFVKDKDIKFFNLDYKDFLINLEFKKDDFIYLDPPYLISNSEYNKLWNENNEKNLLDLLDYVNKKNVRFAISNIVFHKNSTNGIFKKWMNKYNIYDIKSNYISYHDNSIKKISEVLVTNYEKEKKS